MPAFSYDFQTQRRDLSAALNTINEGQIGFIRLFKEGERATNPKVEWYNDKLSARTIQVTANNAGTLTIASSAIPVVGMVIQPEGKPDVFHVSTVTSATSIAIALAGNNGGSLSAATAPTGKYKVISAPIVEGSTKGEDNLHLAGTDFNYTQIWRKEAALTRTAIQTATFGLENSLNKQVEVQLNILSRELNMAALYGQRIQGTGATYDTRGQAGGLYYFATKENALAVNAAGNVVDDFILNDGAQLVQEKGGTANVILCHPGQARIIGGSSADKIRYDRTDNVRGTYVGAVTNSVTGTPMTIIADDAVQPGDVWILDDAAFSLRWMQPIYDWDPQDGEFDGVRRSILGEGTFEFKNILSRACRIHGLADSAAALESIKQGSKVYVTNYNEKA
jgi:hypothetical protein